MHAVFEFSGIDYEYETLECGGSDRYERKEAHQRVCRHFHVAFPKSVHIRYDDVLTNTLRRVSSTIDECRSSRGNRLGGQNRP